MERSRERALRGEGLESSLEVTPLEQTSEEITRRVWEVERVHIPQGLISRWGQVGLSKDGPNSETPCSSHVPFLSLPH